MQLLAGPGYGVGDADATRWDDHMEVLPGAKSLTGKLMGCAMCRWRSTEILLWLTVIIMLLCVAIYAIRAMLFAGLAPKLLSELEQLL